MRVWGRVLGPVKKENCWSSISASGTLEGLVFGLPMCLLALGAEIKQYDEIRKSGRENPCYTQGMGTYWRAKLQRVFCYRDKDETERLNPEEQRER